MDLGSLANKLKDDKYRYVEEFLDDTQLVWDNCKAYNAPGTVIIGLLSGSLTQPKTCKEPSRKWLKTTCPLFLSQFQEVFFLF